MTKTYSSHYPPFGSCIQELQYAYADAGDTSKYRFGFNGMEQNNELYELVNSFFSEFRQFDSRIGRWMSIDPLFEKFPWQSPYIAMDNNPIYLIDNKGDSTFVKDLGSGKYKVIGGNLAGDHNGIFIKDAITGKIGKMIGYSLTPYSFYNTDKPEKYDINNWKGVINTADLSGKNFLNKTITAIDPFYYAFNAYGGQPFDFKVTNGTGQKIGSENHLRGMPIMGKVHGYQVFASARDIGNLAAGRVAGSSGLSWDLTRRAFDAVNGSKETAQSQYAQAIGWFIGIREFSNKNALIQNKLGFFGPPIKITPHPKSILSSQKYLHPYYN